MQSDDPKERLSVQEIDAEADLSELEVVFGVGSVARQEVASYKGISREELIEDVLSEGSRYSASTVVRDTLPVLLKGAKYVPAFKYLREAGVLDDQGNLTVKDLDSRLATVASSGIERFFPPPQYAKKKHDVVLSKVGIREMESAGGAKEVMYYGALIEPERIDPEDLKNFLLEQRVFYTDGHQLDRSQYIKLVCVLDFLKYRTIHSE